MCVDGTPVEDHRAEWGLWVKREDMCCPGGPNFSKTRGVFAHIAKRPEQIIGVLDTAHSQGGWAVARACAELGKTCVEFYPHFRKPGKTPNEVQDNCQRLGAQTIPLPAGRSAVLYHAARATLARAWGSDSWMMPNALKLSEMVAETAAEVRRTIAPGQTLVQTQPATSRKFTPDLQRISTVLISASSGTIAAGVCQGLVELGWRGDVVIHQGYSRPQGAMRDYMRKCLTDQGWLSTETGLRVTLVDEGYGYADAARPGPTPPWPSNKFYDLKAFRWFQAVGRDKFGEALFWSIG